MIEEKVFGMTLEDVSDVKKSVTEWMDCCADGCKSDFASAFATGAQMLRSDETFRDAFRCCLDECL